MMTFEWKGLRKIISGGQTGADTGGLLAAWRSNVETGGTAPECFKTNDGFNPLLEVLGLTAEGDYRSRTRKNVIDSDGTVIIGHDLNSSGSRLTFGFCADAGKPVLRLDIREIVNMALTNDPATHSKDVAEQIVLLGFELKEFVRKNQISVLNVAGNREINSNGTNAGTLIVTSAADWIVGLAIELLDLEGKLHPRS